MSRPGEQPLLTRRDLLIAGPLAILAGAIAWRAPKYDSARFQHPATSDVALLAADGYDADLVDVVSQGLKLLKVDVRGKRVLLKPNLVEFYPDRVVNTDPSVVAAAVEAFMRHGARSVLVGEGPGHRRDTEYLLTATGLFDRLSELRTGFIDLNQDDVRRVRLGSRFMGLRELMLPGSVLDADLVVSMPKLKTHHWAGMTCSLKNLFGVVPGAVYGWPKNLLHFRGIENSIVDIASTIRPGLAIVDGIVGMEGDGPIMGRPRKVGALVMGTDLVAVDATCARMIGLRPERMPYLATAGTFLGNVQEDRVLHRGESLSRFATTFEVRPGLKGLQEKG